MSDEIVIMKNKSNSEFSDDEFGNEWQYWKQMILMGQRDDAAYWEHVIGRIIAYGKRHVG